MTRETWTWALAVAAVIAAALAAYRFFELRRDKSSLEARLERIVAVKNHTEVFCTELAAKRPLVLLALGQSNAANHGDLKNSAAEPVILISEGKCILAADPLPGGTGEGGSIWQRLPALLRPLLKDPRPVVLSVLAVEATTIDDWTTPQSPLRKRLATHVESMNKLGLTPNLILWQQGEADALRGTSSSEYSAGLARLATVLKEAMTDAPILLARSTLCRSSQNVAVRKAIEETVANSRRLRLGPDTDTLSGKLLRNGCHLTNEGLDGAARMWATSIVMNLAAQ